MLDIVWFNLDMYQVKNKWVRIYKTCSNLDFFRGNRNRSIDIFNYRTIRDAYPARNMRPKLGVAAQDVICKRK